MIEPTDEMIEAFNRGKSAGGMGTGTAGPRPGIAAVLAIVARDYDIRPRQQRWAVELEFRGTNPYRIRTIDAASVVADSAHQDTRSTGAQLRDVQAAACPDCTSPIPAHRYVLPIMTDGVYAGNEPCTNPWHDQPLTITNTSPPAGPRLIRCGCGPEHARDCEYAR